MEKKNHKPEIHFRVTPIINIIAKLKTDITIRAELTWPTNELLSKDKINDAQKRKDGRRINFHEIDY